MIQQVEGFRDDIQMAGSDGNHFQDTKIKVNVWRVLVKACRSISAWLVVRLRSNRPDSLVSWLLVGKKPLGVLDRAEVRAAALRC